MRVLYLSNRVPWFGAHTGYEMLPKYAGAAGIDAVTLFPGTGLLARAKGKAVSLWRGHGRVSQTDAEVRGRLGGGLRRQPASLGHILYGEEHLPYWRDAPESARRRTFVTLHQPSSQLSAVKASALAALPQVIVLWQRELDWFRERIEGGEVYFVPHGVDVDFFSPAPELAPGDKPLRLLYVGVHLRNTAMLARLVPLFHRRHPELQFDLLVPESRRGETHLATLAHHPNVHWYAGVDDAGLRDLYRSAHLLLLPLQNSGANTAVVEALACGLPLVTTDVGGIRDYGGGTIFPVVENNDDEGMLALIEGYLASTGRRYEVARACRAFAVEQLAWPVIARRHAEIYHKVLA